MMERPGQFGAPAQEAEFDQYADSYAQAVNESLVIPGVGVDYFTRVKAGYALDLLDRHCGGASTASLLDIGCGVGNFHPLLSGEVAKLSGCDVSAASLSVAQSRNPDVAYSHYEGERLPYPDESFDAAITVCVMHHVPPAQWPLFLSEMRRVLRPGGLAMVFEHNPLNPLTMRVVNRCEFDANAVLLKRCTTCGLLGDAGFADIQSRAILSIPSRGGLTRRIDEALGVMPFGAQYYAIGKA